MAKTSKNTYNVYTCKNIKLVLTTKNVRSIKYQLVKKDGKWNTKQWKKVNSNSIILKQNVKNSIIYFQYINGSGKKVFVRTKGFTLDKTAPVVNIKNNKTYKKDVRIIFKDTGSGIKRAVLNGKTIKNGKKISTNGTYKLELVDKAGNKKSIRFYRKKISKKPKKTPIPSTPKPTSIPTPKPTEKPKPVAVKSIKLSKSNLELKAKGRGYLSVSVSPANAINREVIWKSCNTNIATVSNGNIVAKNKGVTTIIVYSKQNSSINCSCTVIVK